MFSCKSLPFVGEGDEIETGGRTPTEDPDEGEMGTLQGDDDRLDSNMYKYYRAICAGKQQDDTLRSSAEPLFESIHEDTSAAINEADDLLTSNCMSNNMSSSTKEDIIGGILHNILGDVGDWTVNLDPNSIGGIVGHGVTALADETVTLCAEAGEIIAAAATLAAAAITVSLVFWWNPPVIASVWAASALAELAAVSASATTASLLCSGVAAAPIAAMHQGQNIVMAAKGHLLDIESCEERQHDMGCSGDECTDINHDGTISTWEMRMDGGEHSEYDEMNELVHDPAITEASMPDGMQLFDKSEIAKQGSAAAFESTGVDVEEIFKTIAGDEVTDTFHRIENIVEGLKEKKDEISNMMLDGDIKNTLLTVLGVSTLIMMFALKEVRLKNTRNTFLINEKKREFDNIDNIIENNINRLDKFISNEYLDKIEEKLKTKEDYFNVLKENKMIEIKGSKILYKCPYCKDDKGKKLLLGEKGLDNSEIEAFNHMRSEKHNINHKQSVLVKSDVYNSKKNEYFCPLCKIKLSDGPEKKDGTLVLDENVLKIYDHLYSETHTNHYRKHTYCSDLEILNIYDKKTGNYLCPVCVDQDKKPLILGTKENCGGIIKHFDTDLFKKCEKENNKKVLIEQNIFNKDTNTYSCKICKDKPNFSDSKSALEHVIGREHNANFIKSSKENIKKKKSEINKVLDDKTYDNIDNEKLKLLFKIKGLNGVIELAKKNNINYTFPKSYSQEQIKKELFKNLINSRKKGQKYECPLSDFTTEYDEVLLIYDHNKRLYERFKEQKGSGKTKKKYKKKIKKKTKLKNNRNNKTKNNKTKNKRKKKIQRGGFSFSLKKILVNSPFSREPRDNELISFLTDYHGFIENNKDKKVAANMILDKYTSNKLEPLEYGPFKGNSIISYENDYNSEINYLMDKFKDNDDKRISLINRIEDKQKISKKQWNSLILNENRLKERINKFNEKIESKKIKNDTNVVANLIYNEFKKRKLISENELVDSDSFNKIKGWTDVENMRIYKAKNKGSFADKFSNFTNSLKKVKGTTLKLIAFFGVLTAGVVGGLEIFEHYITDLLKENETFAALKNSLTDTGPYDGSTKIDVTIPCIDIHGQDTGEDGCVWHGTLEQLNRIRFSQGCLTLPPDEEDGEYEYAGLNDDGETGSCIPGFEINDNTQIEITEPHISDDYKEYISPPLGICGTNGHDPPEGESCQNAEVSGRQEWWEEMGIPNPEEKPTSAEGLPLCSSSDDNEWCKIDGADCDNDDCIGLKADRPMTEGWYGNDHDDEILDFDEDREYHEGDPKLPECDEHINDPTCYDTESGSIQIHGSSSDLEGNTEDGDSNILDPHDDKNILKRCNDDGDEDCPCIKLPSEDGTLMEGCFPGSGKIHFHDINGSDSEHDSMFKTLCGGKEDMPPELQGEIPGSIPGVGCWGLLDLYDIVTGEDDAFKKAIDQIQEVALMIIPTLGALAGTKIITSAFCEMYDDEVKESRLFDIDSLRLNRIRRLERWADRYKQGLTLPDIKKDTIIKRLITGDLNKKEFEKLVNELYNKYRSRVKNIINKLKLNENIIVPLFHLKNEDQIEIEYLPKWHEIINIISTNIPEKVDNLLHSVDFKIFLIMEILSIMGNSSRVSLRMYDKFNINLKEKIVKDQNSESIFENDDQQNILLKNYKDVIRKGRNPLKMIDKSHYMEKLDLVADTAMSAGKLYAFNVVSKLAIEEFDTIYDQINPPEGFLDDGSTIIGNITDDIGLTDGGEGEGEGEDEDKLSDSEQRKGASHIDIQDADGDGITNIDEGMNEDRDSDGDGVEDWQDIDSDNPDVQTSSDIGSDGHAVIRDTEGNVVGSRITDDIETDADSKLTWTQRDDDGDGIKNIDEGRDDSDGDGLSDYLDTDSDGDGKSDSEEYNELQKNTKEGEEINMDSIYDGTSNADWWINVITTVAAVGMAKDVILDFVMDRKRIEKKRKNILEKYDKYFKQSLNISQLKKEELIKSQRKFKNKFSDFDDRIKDLNERLQKFKQNNENKSEEEYDQKKESLIISNINKEIKELKAKSNKALEEEGKKIKDIVNDKKGGFKKTKNKNKKEKKKTKNFNKKITKNKFKKTKNKKRKKQKNKKTKRR